jgi:uncharacterized protein YqhQ
MRKNLKLPNYGGQALIEGVLMRGSRYLCAAIRTPDGNIVTQTEELGGLYKSPLVKIPFLRGLIVLWDSIGLGTKYLTISANIQTGEGEKIEGPAYFLSLGLSFIFAIALFFVAPSAIATLFEKWLKITPFIGNLLEGVIRLIFILLYIWGVGKMPEIKRVFSYHGAEHKTINAFEKSIPLEPLQTKTCSLYHPRCGTGFLLILVIFSIILFTLIGPLPSIWIKLASRVILLPVLIAFAYEYMRFSSRLIDHPIFRFLSFPNMYLQRLTTIEPSTEMLEVALVAFKTMYALENSASSVK